MRTLLNLAVGDKVIFANNDVNAFARVCINLSHDQTQKPVYSIMAVRDVAQDDLKDVGHPQQIIIDDNDGGWWSGLFFIPYQGLHVVGS